MACPSPSLRPAAGAYDPVCFRYGDNVRSPARSPLGRRSTDLMDSARQPLFNATFCVPDENRDIHAEDDIKRQRTQYNGDPLYSNVSVIDKRRRAPLGPRFMF